MLSAVVGCGDMTVNKKDSTLPQGVYFSANTQGKLQKVSNDAMKINRGIRQSHGGALRRSF